MANSAFWRALASEFHQLRNSERLRSGDYRELEALVKRCASELDVETLDLSALPKIESSAEPGVYDPFFIWLTALKNEDLTSKFTDEPSETMNENEAALTMSARAVAGMRRAGIALCKKLEGQEQQREKDAKIHSDVMTLIQNANHTPQKGAARPRRNYRSSVKRHIANALTNNPSASALQVCGYLDEQDLDVDRIPSSWLKNGNRELTVAYRDKAVRRQIDSQISKVRRDLGT